MARPFSIKGPARDGAMALDEGALTKAVVDRLGAKTGADGNQRAGEIWAARRDLWRVLEACAPRVVAKHLRKRANKAQDYSNRGAVGDLRRLVADWLDPPEPVCAGCRRPVSARHAHRRRRPVAPAPAPGRPVVGQVRAKAWRAAVAGWEAERARQVAKHIATRREWVRQIRERTPGRGAPLELFGTLAGARGSPRRVVHGGADVDGGLVTPFPGERRPADLPPSRRYDVEVDRDGAVLRDSVREVLGDDLFAALAAGHDPIARVLATRPAACRDGLAIDSTARAGLVRAYARAPLIAVRWWRFCRVLERAFEENGRLYLKAQGKYSPAGTVTRADLVQESAGGAIRGLYDYNPKHGKHGCKVSTYLVGWCRQGMSKAFAGRDEVRTPAWLRDLRANLERAGVELRAGRLAVEACSALRGATPPRGVGGTATATKGASKKGASKKAAKAWTKAREAEACAVAVKVVTAASASRPPNAWDPAVDPVLLASPPKAMGETSLRAFRAGKATLAEVWAARRFDIITHLQVELLATPGEVLRQEAGARALALAAGLVVKSPRAASTAAATGAGKPSKGAAKVKAGPRGRKGKSKPPARAKGAPVGVTGTGVLQALMFEEPRRHGLVFGGGEGGDAESGEAYDPRSREPADEDDPERLLLAAETVDAQALARTALADALEALRREDPRACEVVRRREGLGEQGDGESLAQISEGLDGDSPRRPLPRDEARRLYTRGVARLRKLIGDLDGHAPGLAFFGNEDDTDGDDLAEAPPSPPAHMRSPWRTGPLRPALVHTTVAEPRASAVSPAPPLAERAQTAAWLLARDTAAAINW